MNQNALPATQPPALDRGARIAQALKAVKAAMDSKDVSAETLIDVETSFAARRADALERIADGEPHP